MPIRFTQKAQKTLTGAQSIAEELGHTYVGSEHILLALCKEKDSVASRLLTTRGAAYTTIKNCLTELYGEGSPSRLSRSDMTPMTKRIIESAAKEASETSSSTIGTEHLLLALINERDSMGAKLLEKGGVSLHELRSDITAFISVSTDKHRGARQKDKQEDIPAIVGAPTLSLYGKDLTALATKGKIDTVIGRDDETERVIAILSRRGKNNPCLIGEPGVGKTAVVEGLATRISNGNVPKNLSAKRIVSLDLSAMIAGSKYRGEFEERMKTVMQEVAKASDIILFIDEMHMLIGAGAAEGAVDAANIIKPALARGELQMIGATTIAEYRAHVEKDAALERRFQSVSVDEPTFDEALKILEGLRPSYEAHHKILISDDAIRSAVNLSTRYIPDRYLPDKAIDLIDEAAATVRIKRFSAPSSLSKIDSELRELSSKKENAVKEQDFELAASIRAREKELLRQYENEKLFIEQSDADADITLNAEDIAQVVRVWTGIPVTKLIEKESEKLNSLSDELKKRVIGQDEAINSVSSAIKRSRSGLKDPKRPVGSFIFLGKTGVGKTELAKSLATVMFGSPDSVIRLDMAEYMESHSVAKLIGAPPGYVGYGEGGQLTERVRRKPYSLILLDEIEKAHKDVFNLLLSVLEDGVLTDSTGRRVDFKNTIIIMTSNVGASYTASAPLGFSTTKTADPKTFELNARAELKRSFSPEFLNRVDDVIVFKPLGEAALTKVACGMLKELASRCEKLGITLIIDDEVPAEIASRSFSDAYGARELRRHITREVENKLSCMIVDGSVIEGDTVYISFDNGEITHKVLSKKSICTAEAY